jgi:ABC-type transport system substrate-binding protein
VLPELSRHTYAYTLHIDPSFTLQHVEFNLDHMYHGHPNPLADTKVRLALALAVDKLKLIRDALDFGERDARDFVAWSFLVNSPRLSQLFADTTLTGQWDPMSGSFVSNTGHGQALDDARALLARSHWKKGFTADFYTIGITSFEATVRSLAAAWAKIGVRLVPHFISADQLFQDWQHGGVLARGAFQVGLWWNLSPPDPDPLRIFMQSRYIDRRQARHRAINQNFAGIVDGTIDRSFDVEGASMDPKVRQNSYVAIQREVNRQAYWIPLYYLPFPSTSDDRIANFVNSPTSGPEWNVYAWKAKR